MKKSKGGVLHVGNSSSPFPAPSVEGSGSDNIYNLPEASGSPKPVVSMPMPPGAKDYDEIVSGGVRTGSMKQPMKLPRD